MLADYDPPKYTAQDVLAGGADTDPDIAVWYHHINNFNKTTLSWLDRI